MLISRREQATTPSRWLTPPFPMMGFWPFQTLNNWTHVLLVACCYQEASLRITQWPRTELRAI